MLIYELKITDIRFQSFYIHYSQIGYKSNFLTESSVLLNRCEYSIDKSAGISFDKTPTATLMFSSKSYVLTEHTVVGPIF